MPGTILSGRYRIERTVGQGSMGIVLEATDMTLQYRVALKVMSPDRAHNDEARKRFIREARAVMQLSNVHVTRMFEVGELADGVPFLVMEFLSGNTLEHVLFSSGPPSIDVVMDWALQALEGMAEAHRLGFVHRDIKPENLFLHEAPGAPPVVKVLDFGAVKELKSGSTKLTKTGSTMGSPAYMPPEQVRAEENIDQRADVWAMGVTIYELITGDLPFGGESVPQTLAGILRDEPKPLRSRRPEASPELEALIHRALSKDRNHRFLNCGEMLDALRGVRMKLQQTSPVTKTLFFNPASTPRPGMAPGDGFAETTEMRKAIAAKLAATVPLGAPPGPPSGEDTSRVRERPRVVINERGQVVTSNNAATMVTRKSSTPVLPFFLAVFGGLVVAAIVVLIVSWTQNRRDQRAHDRNPAASVTAKPAPKK